MKAFNLMMTMMRRREINLYMYNKGKKTKEIWAKITIYHMHQAL